LSVSAGDCTCPISNTLNFYNSALVEADETGNLLAAKTCMACPSGQFVVTDSPISTGEYH
jgi:hypothetical protein